MSTTYARPRPATAGFATLVIAEVKRLAWRRLTWVVAGGEALFGLLMLVPVLMGARKYVSEASVGEMASMTQMAGGVCLALGAALIASSYIGAESASGSLGAWLTFTPRRSRVFWSKAVAVTCFSAAMAAVFLGTLFVLVALGMGVQYTGLMVVTAAPALVRAVVLVAVAGLAGFAIVVLFGHTAATPAVVAAYGVFAVVRSSLFHGSYPAWPEHMLAAFVLGEVQLPIYVEHRYAGLVTLTAGPAAVYLGVLVAIIVGAAWFRFCRRDYQ